MPLAMLFGILAIAGGLIFLPLGQLLGLLAWPFTAWLISGAHLLASVPMASVNVPPFGAWWVWGWYALVATLAWWHAHRHTTLAIT